MGEIIDLPEGAVIDAPGFYRISLDRHHAQPCMTRDRLAEIQSGAAPEPHEVSVTSGVLRKMELETPADVWAFSLLNPRRYEPVEKPALRMGRAIAAMIEGGVMELEKHFVVPEDDAPRRPTPQQLLAYEEERATEAGIMSVEYWRAMDADPRVVLKQSEWELIVAMGEVLSLSPEAAAVMEGLPEVTMAWQDERTGIWCLARPDTVSLEGLVADYKKMATRGDPFSYRLVDRRITQHGYDMQMAFACEGFERLTGGWPASVGIVAQNDTPPYHVILREIADEDLRLAQFLNRRALNRFAECLTLGSWPGPGADTGAYQMPDWKRERVLQDMTIAYQ